MFFSLVIVIVSSIFLEFWIQPKLFLRKITGLHTALILVVYGLVLAALGNIWVACWTTVLVFFILVTVSNLKFRVLGEPLVFTDIAVAGSFLRYPRFYLAAIPLLLKILILPVVIGTGWWMAYLFSMDWSPHLAGFLIASVSGGWLWAGWCFYYQRYLMLEPNLTGDVRSYGLLPTLFSYFLRWRRTSAPKKTLPLIPAQCSAPFLVIVQCESFADPACIAAQRDFPPLPTLARLRNLQGVMHGSLNVSGFGAYTMRTEFGVLFGQSEATLGFRRYDPFLTAKDSTSCALPNMLSASYDSRVFVHPHDLRFYGRERLLPEMGFTEVIGPEAFKKGDHVGPYVGDEVLGKLLSARIRSASRPELIYTVTMENHGPWNGARMNTADALDTWYQHAMNSDRMLNELDEALCNCGQDACLVFFGDHRPSIPEVVNPGAERGTPYIVRRYSSKDVPPPLTGYIDEPSDIYQFVLDLIGYARDNGD
nr:LTA synthase family protein [Saccharibacter sp. 17.LH.SD]